MSLHFFLSPGSVFEDLILNHLPLCETLCHFATFDENDREPSFHWLCALQHNFAHMLFDTTIRHDSGALPLHRWEKQGLEQVSADAPTWTHIIWFERDCSCLGLTSKKTSASLTFTCALAGDCDIPPDPLQKMAAIYFSWKGWRIYFLEAGGLTRQTLKVVSNHTVTNQSLLKQEHLWIIVWRQAISRSN